MQLENRDTNIIMELSHIYEAFSSTMIIPWAHPNYQKLGDCLQ